MKVVWSRRAIRHLVYLREYIEKDSEQNAARVAKHILRAVDLLQTQPEMGQPGRVLGTRELVVQQTPYLTSFPTGSARAAGTDCCVSRPPEVAGQTLVDRSGTHASRR
jgi:toxin ParE1/3/4